MGAGHSFNFSHTISVTGSESGLSPADRVALGRALDATCQQTIREVKDLMQRGQL